MARVALCAIAKNENNYIKEWVEHYLNLGFEHIYIYDNNDINGESIKDVLMETDKVTIVDVRGEKYAQLPSYNACFDNYKHLYDWFAFFDLDELLFIENGVKISDFVERKIFDGKEIIRFSWEHYSDSGLVNVKNNDYSFNRFTETVKHPKDKFGKSILRTTLKTNNKIQDHGLYGIPACNAIGKPCLNKDCVVSLRPLYKEAWIKHYPTKTIEEYIKCKYKRGDAKDAKNEKKYDSLSHFWEYNKKTSDKLYYIENMNTNNFKVALCTIAKNENRYIREWVEHYKKLGISKIFLYDNNEKDGERFEDVISDYLSDNFVEIIDVRGTEKGCVYDKNGLNLQPKCYIECYEQHSKDFDWMCFFDIDEFLMFKDGNTLNKFLNRKAFNRATTILVSWEQFSDSGKLYYEDKPVVERFKEKSTINRYGVKSIVRCGKTVDKRDYHNMIHHFRIKFGTLMYADGKTHFKNTSKWIQVTKKQHENCDVVLNHYKTKSAEEFLERHLGRHWGTDYKVTKENENIEKCFDIYFMFNKKTKEKISFFVEHGYKEKQEKTYVKKVIKKPEVIRSKFGGGTEIKKKAKFAPNVKKNNAKPEPSDMSIRERIMMKRANRKTRRMETSKKQNRPKFNVSSAFGNI